MPAIRHNIFIASSAQTIFEALTKEDGLSAWWTPETRAKAEQGFVCRFSFGPRYFKEMQIAGLDPNRTVEWLCVWGAHEWMGTTITFNLHEGTVKELLKHHPETEGQIQQRHQHKGGTILRFVHDNWNEESPMLAECNYTWALFLRSLKLFCETGKGTPWPGQH